MLLAVIVNLVVLVVLVSKSISQTHDEVEEPSLQRLYWSNTSLGLRDYDITIGNPLRGLVSNPNIINPGNSGVPFSLEAYYFPFNGVVRGRNIQTGKWEYDWTGFEAWLNDVVTSHTAQSIPRFFIFYPGQPLALPQYLLDNVKTGYDIQKGRYPLFNDKILLLAIQDFIREFGRLYDNDKRIAFIQTGLLGAWGEWHCGGTPCMVDAVADTVARWWFEAFSKKKLQIRFPLGSSKSFPNIGYHDDSFTRATLDGPYNGGVLRNLFFWNNLRNNGLENWWKTSVTGGEIHPNNSDVFKSSYPANSEYHQPFMPCVEIVHATYIKSHHIFRDELTSEEREIAKFATARMGYAFELKRVGAALGTTPTTVDITVTIEQIGVAPFYYGLALQLSCVDLNKPLLIWGIQRDLVEKSNSYTYIFAAVPATLACLSSVRLSLKSEMVYSTIKLAQADGTVFVNIPLPPAGMAPTNVTLASSAPAADKVIRTGGLLDEL